MCQTKTGIIIGGTLNDCAGLDEIGAAVAPTPLWLPSFSHYSGYRRSSETSVQVSHWHPSGRRGPGALTIIVRTITVAFQHAVDKAADNGNLTAISWI
ncbi:PTS sugar transporter subunit IIC [Shigella sonnei]